MKVEFLARFDKDLDEISDRRVLDALAELIEPLEVAQNLSDLPNVKKMAGFRDAFRFRIGQYRIGVFLKESMVEFARIAHRKDIYQLFP